MNADAPRTSRGASAFGFLLAKATSQAELHSALVAILIGQQNRRSP